MEYQNASSDILRKNTIKTRSVCFPHLCPHGRVLAEAPRVLFLGEAGGVVVDVQDRHLHLRHVRERLGLAGVGGGHGKDVRGDLGRGLEKKYYFYLAAAAGRLIRGGE